MDTDNSVLKARGAGLITPYNTKYWTMSSLTNSYVCQFQKAREMLPVKMITLSTYPKPMASLGVLKSSCLEKITKTSPSTFLCNKSACNKK